MCLSLHLSRTGPHPPDGRGVYSSINVNISFYRYNDYTYPPHQQKLCQWRIIRIEICEVRTPFRVRRVKAALIRTVESYLLVCIQRGINRLCEAPCTSLLTKVSPASLFPPARLGTSEKYHYDQFRVISSNPYHDSSVPWLASVQ